VFGSFIQALFSPETWGAVPFHFWSLAIFTLGCVVGSFLNVVIHRLPREESIVSPPSHCPHCRYSIPWYLNIPLVTWLWLRGKCANCGAPISVRYLLVEALTGALFLGCWLVYGETHSGVALIFCLLMAGFVAASFIDFEHFIIPDQITIGGIFAGLGLSILCPALHGGESAKQGMEGGFWGIAVGGLLLYGILRAGKLLFGKRKLELPPGTTIIFGEETLKLPGEEIPYGDMLYRKGDFVEVEAEKVTMGERGFGPVRLRLYQDRLEIGEETFDPASVNHLEVVAARLVLPREAMGFGDVKFMAAIGAFLGWQGVLFSLMLSSILGAAVGIILIALGKRQWSQWIPYGPYIALAAIIYVYWGEAILRRVLNLG